MFLKILSVLMLLSLASFLQGCAGSAAEAPAPSPIAHSSAASEVRWPRDQLKQNASGVPLLDVYVLADEKVETMDMETYLQGVLAGEMKNDWPMEALKAQAILARTFVLKFVDEKESRYEGAQISTDIEEAQAYDAASINDRIRQAVAETKGLVLSASGELPYAWFHAHSGGRTELAKPGLGWNDDEPAYTHSVAGNEPESVPDEADQASLRDAQRWTAVFPYAEFKAACASLGVETGVNDSTELVIAQRGESGRASVINVDGHPVDAAELRIALGSTKMRSTQLTSLLTENGKVHMAGRGYGHGVGMSQWGAYGMAQAGKQAEEIAAHYFKGVTVEKIY